MNETTIMENHPFSNGQIENEVEGVAWKQVTLGGVSGILMGAGLLHAGRGIFAATKTDEVITSEEAEQQQVGDTSDNLQVAQMNNELSFGEAFAAARAEVGPGGVFYWHGGIYNTYTAEEWNSMTLDQKNDFAHQVNPEIQAHTVQTPTDAQPDVTAHAIEGNSEDVQVVGQQDVADTLSEDSDVHIVGYGGVEGHLAVALDTTGDGHADVAIIDIDDSGDLTRPDLVVDGYGNVASVGEIVDAHDPNQMAAMESSDITNEDTTDYDMQFIET